MTTALVHICHVENTVLDPILLITGDIYTIKILLGIKKFHCLWVGHFPGMATNSIPLIIMHLADDQFHWWYTSITALMSKCHGSHEVNE